MYTTLSSSKLSLLSSSPKVEYACIWENIASLFKNIS